MTAIEPVRREVHVAVPVEQAFSVYTERISEWWPLEDHSRAGMGEGSAPIVGALIEPREGGRVVERLGDGSELSWGTVAAWEPPHRLAIAWRPNDTDPEPTHVEIRFTADGDGTRVELVHTGWERLGPDRARESRGSYDRGWEKVQSAFAAHAGAAAGTPAG